MTQEGDSTILDLSEIFWPLDSLLFLDFDGVLHQADGGRVWFDRMPDFCSFMDSKVGTGVVITSSWREDSSFDALLSYFPETLRHRIVGTTPILPCGRSDGGRWREISSFLTKNGLAGCSIAVLDDEPRLFPEGLPCLLVTDSSGMTIVDAKRLPSVFVEVDESMLQNVGAEDSLDGSDSEFMEAQ